MDANEGTPLVLSTRAWRAQAPSVMGRDFRLPPRPSGRRMRELEGIARDLAARIEGATARYLRSAIAVNASSVTLRPYEDVAREEPVADGPGSWFVPLVATGGERAVLRLDGALQLHLLARLLGEPAGPGVAPNAADAPGAADADAAGDESSDAGADAESADAGEPADAHAEDAAALASPRRVPRVGPVSRAALRPYVRLLVAEVNTLLRRGTDPFTLDTERENLAPQRLLRGSDVFAVLAFDVAEGDARGGAAVLLHLTALAPLLHSEDEGSRGATTVVEPRLRNRLEGIARTFACEVAVTLGAAEIELSAFLRLAPGDVLVLGRRLDEPLELSANGRPLFAASPGRSGGRLAARIQHEIRKEMP